MHERIRQLIKRLLETGLATRSRIRGFTDEEVAELQDKVGVDLPPVFVDYLLAGGKELGIFCPASDATYEDLSHVNRQARTLARSSGTLLPGDAFVFYMHHGYEFMFFRCDGETDPKVHYFLEGEPIRPLRVTFGDWLLAGIEAEDDRNQSRPSWW